RAAVAVEAGAAPSPGDAYTLQKTSDESAEYRLEPAWPVATVSAALGVWCEAYLEREIEFTFRAPTSAEVDAIAELVGAPEDPEIDTEPLGHDAEVAALVEGYEVIFWFQPDLTWPDRDDDEAFRDRVDVRIRAEGVDTWLLSVEPIHG